MESTGTNIVTTFVNAFTTFVTGCVDAISGAFDGLLLNAEGTGLSTLAIWGLVFAGTSLAIGIVSAFTRKLG